ncbi:MAG: hypothetical protein JXM73_10455 [Anaerolineae bacterium]|nr:hypothetical protein [Anaerolineae bacterium]
MSKGYAVGFLLVLLIVLLGLYVAFTGFMSTREALRAQATPAPTGQVGQATRAATRAAPTPTATIMALPNGIPMITDTVTPAPTLPPTAEPSATPKPSKPTSTPRPTVPPVKVPTATPVETFQFRVLSTQPDNSLAGCCYIYGTIRDAKGNLLEGVLIQASNQWDTKSATTKGGTETGWYDILIYLDKGTYIVTLVDAAGNQLSSQAVVNFDRSVAGWYRVDWQRTY